MVADLKETLEAALQRLHDPTYSFLNYSCIRRALCLSPLGNLGRVSSRKSRRVLAQEGAWRAGSPWSSTPLHHETPPPGSDDSIDVSLSIEGNVTKHMSTAGGGDRG